MPSRAVTSFLLDNREVFDHKLGPCQCPHGLLPHFYNKEIAKNIGMCKGVNALTGCYLISTKMMSMLIPMTKQRCQCPHGLLPHFYCGKPLRIKPPPICVNALTGCYLISTVPLQKPRFYAVSRACFCRYLSEYSDSSSFSCMLTIWTYLMRQIIPLTLI